MIGNLLNMALSAVGQQSFQYYANISRTLQPNGQYLPGYAAPVAMTGSVQPVPKTLYEMYGLEYVMFRPFNVYGPRMDVFGAYTDWTPITGRPGLFKEDIDKRDPWQFTNVLVS